MLKDLDAAVARRSSRAARRRSGVPTPVVRAIATANPPHRVSQHEAREAARALYPRLAARANMLDVFTNALIDTRHVAMPAEWYVQPHSWAEKNDLTCREQLRLSVEVARRALGDARVDLADVDAVVFVTSSAVSAPSLDTALIGALGLPVTTVRVPMFGLGCAGGAAGLARAADLVRAGFENVLLVAVELCSMTLVSGDESSSNFVAVALFGDGAAAVVLGPEGAGDGSAGQRLPRLHGAYSTLIPDSADVMGWDVTDDGLRVRFARSIPDLVRDMMRQNVRDALNANGWDGVEPQHFVVHPGGAKVLRAFEETLDLAPGALDPSYEVLRNYGNMSSPSVLFVLQAYLRRQPRGPGLLTAMGPGFCAEHVLLEF